MAILLMRQNYPDMHPTRFALALAAVLGFNTAVSALAAMIPLRLGLKNLLATEF